MQLPDVTKAVMHRLKVEDSNQELASNIIAAVSDMVYEDAEMLVHLLGIGIARHESVNPPPQSLTT